MVNRWWANHPSEKYWIEITDRPDIGANLKAPQGPVSGWFLVKEVQSGDIVYHYDKNKRSFVGRSYATGKWWEADIEWPHTRPGWYTELVGYEGIDPPIPLSRIREDWDQIAEKISELRSMFKPAYFPFESGEKRPTQPVQGGYVCKMPRFLVEFLDLLDPGQPLSEKSTSSQPPPSIGITAKDIVSPFGRQLEAAMLVKGYNSSQVARLADCNPSTVRNIISGRIKNPSIEMSERIEKALEEDFENIDTDIVDETPITFEPGEDSEFAYEKDLQNFLSQNLDRIEPGLRLYKDGIEFPVGRKRIDILALDQENQLVVIELKVSRGHDRTVGQILHYIGWVIENEARKDQVVRGIIIAKEITEDIRIALRYTDFAISLREYSMSVSTREVE